MGTEMHHQEDVSHRLLSIDRHLTDQSVALNGIRSKLDAALSSLTALRAQGRAIVALVDDLKAGMAAIDTETTNLGNRIDVLVLKLKDASISDADKADVLNLLSAEAARLKTLAVDQGTPVPPVPPALAAHRSKL